MTQKMKKEATEDPKTISLNEQETFNSARFVRCRWGKFITFFSGLRFVIRRIVNTLWEITENILHSSEEESVGETEAKSFKSDEKQLFAFGIKKFLLLVALKT